MTRVVVIVFVLLALSGSALAQPPRGEVVGQAGLEFRHGSSPALSPRLTFPVAERSAVEVAATHRPLTADRFRIGRGATGVDIVLRQSLHAAGRFEVYGLVGATPTASSRVGPGCVRIRSAPEESAA